MAIHFYAISQRLNFSDRLNLSRRGCRRPLLACLGCTLSAIGLLEPALADEFVLKDGRQISGILVREKSTGDESEKFLVVEVAAGSHMMIKPSEIKKHVRINKAEQDYNELIKSSYADTVPYHLQAAAYCRQNGLAKQEVAHYERVLELDPDEKTARASLKYMRDKDGRWVKRDAIMTEARGKVLIGGKYEFPELVAIREAQSKANLERVQLANEIRKLQQDVTSGNRRAGESMEKLKSLEGPTVSAALAEILFPKANAVVRREAAPEELRLVYVAVLERLADGGAVQALVRLSLSDASLPIRDRALDALRKIAPKPATAAFVAALRNPTETNAAGRALAAMGDEMAILPLIEHLTTTRIDKVSLGGPPNIGMNNAGGAGGLTYGNAPTQNVQTILPNEDVQQALTILTQKNFNYDKQAWLDWYTQVYLSSSSDLRRDP